MNNDKLIELSLKINEEILSLPLIKEYQKLEKLILNDKILSNIDYEIRKAQKEMVEYSTKEDYHLYQDKYLKLLDLTKDNPLFQNYLSLKEEVENTLHQISSLIKKDL